MSSTTITFYKNTKLDDLKNFVIDDIETYLASKSSKVVTGFQYQRFLLNTSIKLDQNQSYLLKGAALNRYDYCKISIVNSNNTTINYYYFIMRASWKAEGTIQFELKMDTLNTYKLSNVDADDSYVLSKKTLVTREHKDRIKFLKNVNAFKSKEPTIEVVSIQNWKNSQAIIGTFTIKFDAHQVYVDMLELTPSLTYPCDIVPNAQTIDIDICDKELNIEQEYLSIYKAQIYQNYLRIYVNANDYIDYLYHNPDNIILFSVTGGIGTPTSFSVSATWNYFKTYFLEDKVYEPITHTFYEKVINQYQEGLGTTLFKNREETLYDADGINQWYVVYASTLAVTTTADDTEAKYVNPVAVRFYCDRGYKVSTTAAKVVTFYAKDLVDYDDYAEYILLNAETLGTGYFEYNGVQYHASDIPTGAVGFSIRRDSKYLFSYLGAYSYNDFGMRYEWSTAVDSNSASFIRFYGINSVPIYKASGSLSTASYWKTTSVNIGSGVGSLSGTASPWSQVDLTSALLIKAFAFPYVPCDWLVGKTNFDAMPSNVTWSSDGVCFELVAPQVEAFDRNIEFNQESPFNICFIKDINIGEKKSRNIALESKLLHSDYFQPKFVYDSFAFTFNLEDVDVSKIEMEQNFIAQYVVSKNVVSKFAFIFNQYVCKREVQNYNNVLTIERNNEKALFNNAYINYIRSGGYNYDSKKASSQNAINGITTALSVMGGTASLVAGWGTGNAMLMTGGIAILSSTAAMVARNIHTAQEQDRAIGQKLNQQVMQGTSVQGSEDIDILTAFSGNKAKLCYYELSDIMKQAMWDLFHYCGYATHEQKVPDVTTRLYFNYVQADIVYEEFSFDEDIADDIKNKWKQGVTFFHKVSGEYDIEQQYENFEVSLI